MANDKKFTTDDIKSGFIVELRNGRRFIAARAGGGNFTKILVDPATGEWMYLSYYNRETLSCGGSCRVDRDTSKDIVRVYGLISATREYGLVFDEGFVNSRALLWQRREPVKMTLKQIEEKLGHEVQIVSEVNADEE